MILGSVSPITPKLPQKKAYITPNYPKRSDTKEISEAHNRINVGIYVVTNKDR